MGSVKDLKIIEQASKESPGKGRFIFSDRYSVFDWGEMPDHIPHKGEALCMVTAYFFEKLKEKGIETHYQGVVKDGEVKKLEDLLSPSNEMEVSLVNVIEPDYSNGKYNYSAYKEEVKNCLIPLEIIYRNTLPEHSSFRKRAKSGKIDIEDYGLQTMPEPGDFLKNPIFDVSTKLESSDRYISWSEARKISGLDERELQDILKLLTEVNNLITDEVRKAGLKNLDGKIELAFDSSRQLMVVDALGTPDECRFSYDGFSISKEAIRKYYRETKWFTELKNKKEVGNPKWRDNISDPDPLPDKLLDLVSQLYMTCTNEITGREWFGNTASFAEIKAGIQEIIK